MLRSRSWLVALGLPLLAAVACSDGSAGRRDSGAATPPAAMTSAMMVDSAMVMLHGFCAAQGTDRPDAGGAAAAPGLRVELIVGGDATRRATRITLAADSTGAAGLTAELTAGSDAHAMCAGPGRSIVIGGTAMFLGAPTLRVVASGPVTVVARTVNAETLAGPVQLRPGQRGVVLAWGEGKR